MTNELKLKLKRIACYVACALLGFCLCGFIGSTVAQDAIVASKYSERTIKELMFVHEWITRENVSTAITNKREWKLYLVTDRRVAVYELQHKAPFVFEWEAH